MESATFHPFHPSHCDCGWICKTRGLVKTAPESDFKRTWFTQTFDNSSEFVKGISSASSFLLDLIPYCVRVMRDFAPGFCKVAGGPKRASMTTRSCCPGGSHAHEHGVACLVLAEGRDIARVLLLLPRRRIRIRTQLLRQREEGAAVRR